MSPDAALARFTARAAARRTLPWAAAYAVVVWSSAATFATAYPTRVERVSLAASLRVNTGLSALFGPMHHLDTVWGFTAWRSVGLLTIVGGVWGSLAGARLQRGEEDTGRWDFVLAGGTSRRRAAAVVLGAGAAALLCLWLAVLGAVALGRFAAPLPPARAVDLSTAVVLPAAMFYATGALCGQVAGSRHLATRMSAALFGAAFLTRVVATATGHVSLDWLSPVGWTDRLRPLAGLRMLPLLLLLGSIAAAVVATIVLAGRRDAGAGFVRPVARRRAGMRLLGSAGAFAVRTVRPVALGWAVGLAVVATVLGLVSHSVTDVARRSGALRSLAERLGASAGSRLFLGVAMTVVLSAVALAAAAMAGAAADEERTGRLDALLGGSLARTVWLGERLAVAVAVLAMLGLVVGTALWAATGAAGSPLPYPTLLAAGANLVPPAVFVLGVAAAAFGLAPRLTAPVAYGLVAWSFLLELVGGMLDAPGWLLDLSLLHHVAVAPAAAPRWGTAAVLAGLGALAALAGFVAFAHRDVTRT